MKKLQILIPILAVLLTACGSVQNNDIDDNNTDDTVVTPVDDDTGGGGDNNDDHGGTDTPTLTVMEKGKSYPMASGQAIVKQSNDAQVILNTDTRTGETSAILQQGSASIEEK